MEAMEEKWQGAEARVSVLTDYFGRRAVLKQRFRKTYRHPQLDQKLLTRRIIQETRCLAKAVRSRVAAPAVYFVDPLEGTIIMEHIAGATAKQVIQKALLPRDVVAEKIGRLVASAHGCDLIHGDLTTSNIIFREGGSDEAVLIDFGLAQVSTMIEDRAVDLYVLERALLSTHPGSAELFTGILNAYAAHLPADSAKAVLDKLADGKSGLE